VNPNTIILLAYLGFNLFVIGSIMYKTFVSNSTRAWPTVPGRVLSSRVSYDRSNRETDGFPYVTYSYEVNGKTYQDANIVPGELYTGSQTYAEKIVARYPKGAAVTVYYNPKNPSSAFLEKYSATDAHDWGLLIGGNVLITLGVLAYKFFIAFIAR
jgi:hypothetical protein